MGLTNLNNDGLAQQAETIGTAMDGNANFPSPPHSPAEMKKQAAALRTAIKEQADAKTKLRTTTSVLKAEKTKTKDMIVTEGAYVALASNGDETKAKSAAMDLRAKPVRSRTLAAPKSVKVVLGDQAHQAKVQWRAGSRSQQEHRVESTMDPAKVDSWAAVRATTTSSIVVDGLVTGAHSFRVIAVAGDRISPPSGVVTIFVP